jgi:ribosomal protein S6--L-glutamate ligase
MTTRIAFLLARRVPPVPSPVLLQVFARLEADGFDVMGWIPEEHLTQADAWAGGADLVVLKSHTELALSLAGTLHGQHVPLLNPYPSCITAQDKITASRVLRAAGIPVPRTWVTGDLSTLEPLLTDGPLIIKPHRGHRGAGISIVHDPAQLAGVPPPEQPVVAQELIAGPGEDLKVYVVGDDVFAVRKAFSADSFTRPGRPVTVTDEVGEIALACGQAFRLGLYGLDIIESPVGPVVVDVNYFPGYKGVDGVAPHIARYIARWATSEPGVQAPAA